MDGNMPVRLAVADDLPAILALYRQLSPYHPLPEPERAEAIWTELLARPGVRVFVAEAGGGAVATCTLIVTPNLTRTGRPYALVENVVTDERVRRQGYGRAVIDAALAAAWNDGCYKAMLLSGRKDEVVLFYESVGFQRGLKTGYQANPPG